MVDIIKLNNIYLAMNIHKVNIYFAMNINKFKKLGVPSRQFPGGNKLKKRGSLAVI
jgi:hypothetical protein